MPDGGSAVVIDGANHYSASVAAGFKVDFKRLAEASGAARLLRIYFSLAFIVADG